MDYDEASVEVLTCMQGCVESVLLRLQRFLSGTQVQLLSTLIMIGNDQQKQLKEKLLFL